jgi:hypothetical protein
VLVRAGDGRRLRLRTVTVGAGLAGVHLLLSAAPAWAAQHEHTLNVPVNIGPLVLRVGLLVAVPAVAGFAMLRGFLTEPSRRTAAFVAGCAAVAVFLEFLLAEGMDFPRQAVIVVLAALAGPLFLILSKDPKFDRFRALLRAVAPWLVTAAFGLAVVEFARVLLGAGSTGVVLPTGVVLALVGMSWFTVCGPGPRLLSALVRVEAALLGNAALAGAAYALVLTLPTLPAAAP